MTLQVMDASERRIVPGFIDSHIHFIMGGERLASVQLADARTKGALRSACVRVTQCGGRHCGRTLQSRLWTACGSSP